MKRLCKGYPGIENFLPIGNSLQVGINEGLKYVEWTSAPLVPNFVLYEATLVSIGALAHVPFA